MSVRGARFNSAMSDPPEDAPSHQPGSLQALTVVAIDPDGELDRQVLAAIATRPALDEIEPQRLFDPLIRILELAMDSGCRTAIIEEFYIDADWRSDHAAFWVKRHERFDQYARRVHFFRPRLSEDDVHDLSGLAEGDYLGFATIRPTDLGPVGRTVLRPPPRRKGHPFRPDDIGMRGARLCEVTETPTLFGNRLKITGVPFMQQDGELLRCAHAATWLCHYVAWERRIIARRLTAELAAQPSAGGSKHRPRPSRGLTVEQMQGLCSELGLPAIFYQADQLPDPPRPMNEDDHVIRVARAVEEVGGWRDALGKVRHPVTGTENAVAVSEEELERERRLRTVAKYVNSGFPVIVTSEKDGVHHAFTIVGWQETPDGPRLIACDDQVGPYEPITDPLDPDTTRGEWKSLLIPLPEKVMLTGEGAEEGASGLVIEYAISSEDLGVQERELASLAKDLLTLRRGDVSIRSRLMRGRDYKSELAGRARDGGLRVLRLATLPHWVWVVEFQSRAKRAANSAEPCVLAEVVLDSTSHDLRPATVLITTASETRDTSLGPASGGVAPGPGGPWQSLINPTSEPEGDELERVA